MAELFAEPLVSFVMGSLGNFLVQEANSLHMVRFHVEQMQIEVRRMQCFLKDANARREGGDEIVRNWITEIREVSLDAEDIIAAFVVKVAYRRRGVVHYAIERCSSVFKKCVARRRVVLQIKDIETKIASLTRSLQTYGIQYTARPDERPTSRFQRQQQLRQTYPHVVEEDIVGLEEDVNNVVNHLLEERTRVVSLWGMGGLGKTTLAKKVYNHSEIGRHFDCVAWVYISQQCNAREVWDGVLSKLVASSPGERERIGNPKPNELAGCLYDVLSRKKCLVILDDIWEPDAWNNLKPGFPVDTNTYSKILLTTRNSNLFPHLHPQHILYPLRHLTNEESWELFTKKISRGRGPTEFMLSTEMEALGREMIEHCGNLPLAIVLLGGLLGTKNTLKEWEAVRKNVRYYLSKGQGTGGLNEVLALSYEDLPYHLKACFLYLSHLPEDREIRPQKLVQMWMAEGFVSEVREVLCGEEETMMKVGMCYLGELVQRSMVLVQLTRFSKRIKFCRLHDLMRDLCLLKAQEENFFKVVRVGTNDNQVIWADSAYSLSSADSAYSSSSAATKIRRIALHYFGDALTEGNVNNPFHGQGRTSHHHIRSFLLDCFDNYLDKNYGWQQIESLLKDFKVIKILDIQGLPHPAVKIFPSVVGNLIHLRDFSIRDSAFEALPSSIGNLRFLQTLDLRVRTRLTIPNVLWRLEQLRHLYLPNTIVIKGKLLQMNGLRKLETLECFNTKTCDVGCFPGLTNLREVRKLWAEPKDLDVIIKSPILDNSKRLLQDCSLYINGDFQAQEEQRLLWQLLECNHIYKLSLRGSMQKFPDQLPKYLTRLELMKSELKEDPMPTLERLQNLRSLIFWPNSYLGKKMVCSAPTSSTTTSNSGGFLQLKYLRLGGTPNLEDWRIEEGAMPGLLHLEISYSLFLTEIPDGLRFITTLCKLEIDGVSDALRDRLQVGGEDYHKIQHVPSVSVL